MIIEEIAIKGYKRLSLNSIELFVYKPNKKIQLILGSNGSGKSSLIKELSPLPAEPNEYSKDGYKKVVCLNNNHRYELQSVFSNTGNKFSFVKNGEELNPGFTVTLYRELVRQEFNITADIHGLMTGRIKFSRMTVAEKRKWFTQIADCDFTFAISFYMKLKEQYRDIQGAIKLQQARLVQETAKVPVDLEENRYKEDIKHLNVFLDHLLSQSDQSVLSASTMRSFDEIQDNIRSTCRYLVKEKSKFTYIDDLNDEESLREAIVTAKTGHKTHEALINSIYREMDEHQKSINLLEQNNLASFKDVDKNIDKLESEIYKIKKVLVYPILKNPEAGLAVLNSIKPQLDEYLTNMIEHAGKGYDKATYTKCLETIDTTTAKLANVKYAIDKLTLQLKEYDHARLHNKVDCPSCKHTWFLGFSQNLYDECLRSKEALDKEVPLLTAYLTTLEVIREQQHTYLTNVSNFVKLIGSVTDLKLFWDHILQTGLLKTEPVAIRRMIQSYMHELSEQQKIDLLMVEMQELFNIRKITAENQLNDLALLKIKHSNLESLALDHQLKIRIYANKEERLTKALQIFKNVNEKKAELESLLIKNESVKADIAKTIKQDYIASCIRLVRSEIAHIAQIISRSDMNKALISSIEKQIKEYQEQSEVYKIMLKELSPTEGLIAKGLVNFINHVVLQMNSFIKQIWLYPLELQPIFQTDDELELDYKFEVKIKDKIDIADVSLGSSAMKEVIDLAFTTVSMKYLKLDKAPLFLDEFSVNMDSAHRKSAFNTVTNLMTNSNHSQVFLISHYEDSYGSIANADITVLCTDNVVIPRGCGYNNCVTFNGANAQTTL